MRHRYRQGGAVRDDPGAVGQQPSAAGIRDSQLRRHEAGCAGAGGLAAGLAGPGRSDGGHVGLLERAVLPAGSRGVRVRAGRREAGQEPARPPQARPVRLKLAGAVLRARRGPALLRAGPRVPDHPAAHPLPPRPDRGADPGEEPRREAARIGRDQAVQRGDRPARRHRPGHHGPPDRRPSRPPDARAASSRPRAPQDQRAGAGPGRGGVLHGLPRRPAQGHARPHRPDRRGDHPPVRGDRTAAGPPGRNSCSRPGRSRAGAAAPPRTCSPRPAPT